VRLAIILGSLAGINVLLVFYYQVLVLTTIGPGLKTDALFAGMVIPGLLLNVISGSMTHVLVPLLAIENEAGFGNQAWSFVQGIAVLFGGFAVVLWLTASVWVPWTVPGFDYPTHLLTIWLVRIQLIGMVFTAVNGVLWAALHARKKFIWVEFSSTLSTIVGFVFLFWGISLWGVAAAAWAMVLRAAFQTSMLMPGLGRYQSLDWRKRSFKEAWQRLYPLLLGTTYYKTDQLVDRFLSSMAPAGQLSLLHFAHQIYGAGNSIIGKAISAPTVPLLSQKAVNKEWSAFNQIYKGRLFWMLLITAIVFLGILLAGNQVLVLLFGHGRFEWSEIIYLKWLLILLGGVWVGGVLGQLLSTSFYAQGNTKTPTIIGSIGYTLGIGLKVMGFYCWGVFGLALGTTFYYIFNTIWLKMALGRRIKLYIQTEG